MWWIATLAAGGLLQQSPQTLYSEEAVKSYLESWGAKVELTQVDLDTQGIITYKGRKFDIYMPNGGCARGPMIVILTRKYLQAQRLPEGKFATWKNSTKSVVTWKYRIDDSIEASIRNHSNLESITPAELKANFEAIVGDTAKLERYVLKGRSYRVELQYGNSDMPPPEWLYSAKPQLDRKITVIDTAELDYLAKAWGWKTSYHRGYGTTWGRYILADGVKIEFFPNRGNETPEYGLLCEIALPGSDWSYEKMQKTFVPSRVGGRDSGLFTQYTFDTTNGIALRDFKAEIDRFVATAKPYAKHNRL